MADLGRAFDEQRKSGQVVDIPLSEETAQIMTDGVPTDDSRTLKELGMSYRPVIETFRDTVAYLRSIGRVPHPESRPRF
jgi:stress response protein YsnF